jgi:hypothetical protein
MGSFVFLLISCPKILIRFAFNSIPTTPTTNSNISRTMVEDPEAIGLLLDVDDNAETHSTSMAGSGSAAAEDIDTSDVLTGILWRLRNKIPPYSNIEDEDPGTVPPYRGAPIKYHPKERFHRAQKILTRILLIISFSALVFLIPTRIVIATGTIIADRHPLYKTLDLAVVVVCNLSLLI